MMQSEVLAMAVKCDLRATDVKNMSYGLININQASQWLNAYKHGRILSAPVIIMLKYMCDTKINIQDVLKDKNTSLVNTIKVTQVKDKTPNEGFVNRNNTIYFKYNNVPYSFIYKAQTYVSFIHDGETITACGDFKNVVGPIEFDTAF